MGPKLKKEIFNKPYFLKISAVFFAIILWFAVSLSLDNTTTVDIKIPVKIATENIIDEMTLKPVSDDYVSSVRVRGNRRILGAIRSDDMEVYADISRVVSAGEYKLPLHANLVKSKDVKIVSVFPSEITVKFDKLVARKLAVIVNTNGISVPEGYAIGKPGTTAKEITVIGPEIELNSIDYCEVVITSGLEPKKTTVFQGNVKLFKEDKTEINSNNISRSLSTMDITIPVFKIKEVPARFEFINQPENFDNNSIEFKQSQKTIKIGCDPEQHDNINEIFLGFVNLNKWAPENTTTTFKLDTILSNDILNAEDVEEIQVEILAKTIERKVLSSNKIELVNKPENRKIKVLTERVSGISVCAPQGNNTLKTLQGTNLAIVADLRDLSPEANGRVAVPVIIKIPGAGDVWVTGEYEIYISVS
ncbi:MAG: hypothetical protein LBJ83_03265 [Oscillospiraceae bacterium]|nr:hypothetical protein [Oscillospiraceae bacterium]